MARDKNGQQDVKNDFMLYTITIDVKVIGALGIA